MEVHVYSLSALPLHEAPDILSPKSTANLAPTSTASLRLGPDAE
jgi:hypothetical protein